MFGDSAHAWFRYSLHSNRVVAKVKRNVSMTAFTVEFLSRILDPGEGATLPKEIAADIFKLLLQDFLPAFNLKPRNEVQASQAPHLDRTVDHSMLRSPLPSIYQSAVKPLTAPVEGDALARLFRAILSLGLRKEAALLLGQIQREAKVQDTKYFALMFLPFLQFIVPVWSEQAIPYTDPICQSLYQSVFRSFLLRFVGQKPQPPTHWSRSRVSCNCFDCKSLNEFLVDPHQSVGYFRVAQKRRGHLHNQLSGGDYTHVTERTGSPHTLVVNKTRRTYDKRLTEWRNRCEEYSTKTLGKFNQNVLQQMLGDQFEELTSTAILERGSQAPRQLMPSTGNGRATAVHGSREPPKQVAGKKRKAVDIIDLT
jgi:hypothetical protein